MHAMQQINSLVYIIYSLFLWFPAEAFTCPTQKEKSTGIRLATWHSLPNILSLTLGAQLPYQE